MANVDAAVASSDEQRLAELGYKQELSRTWSGFQNFAISFTIISILAGCFTTYGQAWNNGGPVAISWGWPLISIPILIIGFCMSELVSAYPTAGGIYWWASKLGGAGWGWFTGWFNLIGLIAVTASVDYGASLFLNTTLGLYDIGLFNGNSADAAAFLHGTFFLFLIVLALHAAVNIGGSHFVARINGVSVWWHVAGVAVILAVLVLVPSQHQSLDFVFTERFNNSGFSGGSTSTLMFWIYILPLGFLLTQYTITGFDSCAHISEETHGAADERRQGRLAVDLLLGDLRLDRAAGADVRRHRHQGHQRTGGRRAVRVDRRSSTPHVGRVGQARPDHLDDRAAVLRGGLPDQRVAHVLRLLA